jgi:hypothetical protein
VCAPRGAATPWRQHARPSPVRAPSERSPHRARRPRARTDGFSLGLHLKDLENALDSVCAPHADGTPVAAPVLELSAALARRALAEHGAAADHTELTRLAARSNRIDFERLGVPVDDRGTGKSA